MKTKNKKYISIASLIFINLFLILSFYSFPVSAQTNSSLLSVSTNSSSDSMPAYSSSNLSAISKNFISTVDEITTTGDELIKQYDPTNMENIFQSMDGFSTLYFKQYEGSGMENTMAAISPDNNKKTEALFRQVIGLINQNAEINELQITWNELKTQLHEDLINLHHQTSGTTFWETCLQAFLILVREGFEALLVIAALMAYLRRANMSHKSHVIYNGVGIGIFMSVITAILFTTFLKTFNASREALEGVVMLFAAAVLIYVSYWLFQYGMRCKEFLNKKIQCAATTGSLATLGIAAFLAVYREGAETILFYQALSFTNPNQKIALGTGFLGACFALCVLYWLMQKATVKIPYRLFFSATAIFLYYMAFSFIGGGITELQEATWIPITPIRWIPPISLLGIYPTVESITAQMFFLIPTSLGLLWWYRNYRNRRVLERV